MTNDEADGDGPSSAKEPSASDDAGSSAADDSVDTDGSMDADGPVGDEEARWSAQLGKDVPLSPPRKCSYCGHAISVARVVQLERGRYGYACLGCAVRT